jgi:molybdopterin-guanine dinucleotide biosynthesis protein B
MTPPFVKIIGSKNSGKTTLVTRLVESLVARGLRVGTVKHTSHDHSFDRPGTDSYRHGAAGSSTALIVSPSQVVCYAETADTGRRESLITHLLADSDVVVWEGHGRDGALALECVAPGCSPRYADDPDVAAFAADEDPGLDRPVFARDEVDEIADWVASRLSLPARNSTPRKDGA